ncbi:alpha/beta fold hydrolase [Cytobacillus horneckiae]|uniref:Alpha/beta hydrolase n=1 Tax=Cytobacillus horneckiae TaxID=549687 RepID=A0A2N0ZMM0_9BACI|nr:alpha/beta hydrolase [Cytobacillus horneckiae]MEC1159147.1 alpha/beta hydrolase [Cytobacillus horneckiae]MED2938839.1 alpha/beta hydrolase [Cytobacillus horneckiae]PKG30747.1 alpha/beta hydrolase [Cytobacillus horneckiae]
MWRQEIIDTKRGPFEVFTKGAGEPLCITHLYSEFNELGYYFAEPFTTNFKVYLVNLKEAGASCQAQTDDELSMLESCKDLEAIREALEIEQWGFAGHSTGGMLALVYSVYFNTSLTKVMIGGSTASKHYMNHQESMYCRESPLNKRIKEIMAILGSPQSARSLRVKVNREWTEMSLYRPENFDRYFSKLSSGKVVPKRLDYYSYQELPNYDIRELLREASVPAFVYCGRHDAQCPLPFSEEITSLLPYSRLYIFEESNHMPYLEEQEKFEAMVIAFSLLRKRGVSIAEQNNDEKKSAEQ